MEAVEAIENGEPPVLSLQSMIHGKALRKKGAILLEGEQEGLSSSMEFLADQSLEQFRKSTSLWPLIPQYLLLVMIGLKIHCYFYVLMDSMGRTSLSIIEGCPW